MTNKQHKPIVILKSTLSRLPLYYCYLKEKVKDGEQYISSATIANSMKLNPIQVRKDIACVSSCAGTPRLGFEIATLLQDFESYLGYDNVDEAVLVGVGGLGRALLSYEGFTEYGLSLVAGFDADESLVSTKVNGKPILPMSKLASFLRRTQIHMAIIAVPKQEAQAVCDLLLQGGVKAIWNFAPTHIEIPEGVLIKNENLAASLAVLSNELNKTRC